MWWGVVRCGEVWWGVVSCGVVWCGEVWCGAVRVVQCNICCDGIVLPPMLQEVARFFKLVALCHTVLANVDEG